jgi:acetyl esterase/lipase
MSRLFVLILLLLLLSACGFANPAPAPAPATESATRPKKPRLPPAPPGVEIEQDVTYLAPGRAEKLDLYLPAKRDPDTRSPAVLLIHGGGWIGGNKAAPREFNVGTTLAAAGYVCASVNYKLEGDERWPTNLFDCKNAVRFLRANAAKLQIDADRIGVIGGSAGGHLALMVAYTSDVPALTPGPADSPYANVSDRVRCVVDLYGITDPRTRRKTDEQGNPLAGTNKACALFPNTTAQSHPDAWRLAAPVAHVTQKTVPTLILHGIADTTVDRDQATQLAEKLKSAGVEHELILLDRVGHTFDLEKWRGQPLPRDVRGAVMSFFDTHLKGD